jgi:hypothetical protein
MGAETVKRALAGEVSQLLARFLTIVVSGVALPLFFWLFSTVNQMQVKLAVIETAVVENKERTVRLETEARSLLKFVATANGGRNVEFR